MGFRIAALIIVLIGLVILVKKLTQATKPLPTAFISALSGVVVLVALNVLSGKNGAMIEMNWVNGIVAAVLGVPGVIGMLVLNLIGNIWPM